jgi:benzoate membrane transport protein
MTIVVGLMTIANAFLGGHPAAMARTSSAMLGGSAAGPLEKRYWAAIVAFLPAVAVALSAGVVMALVTVLPAEYILAVAGLAILASFEDALVRSFSGPLKVGASVAFAVTLSSVTIAGLPSAFWALAAGIGVSLIVERNEILGSVTSSAESAGGDAPDANAWKASKLGALSPSPARSRGASYSP